MSNIRVKTVSDERMFGVDGQVESEHLTEGLEAVETEVGPKNDGNDADDERRGNLDRVGGWEGADDTARYP